MLSYFENYRKVGFTTKHHVIRKNILENNEDMKTSHQEKKL